MSWLEPQPTKPDSYLLNIDNSIGAGIASTVIVAVGVGLLGVATVSPKWVRPIMLGGAALLGHSAGQVAKIRRRSSSRMDTARTVSDNAYADNLLQELTIPMAISAPIAARTLYGGGVSGEGEEGKDDPNVISPKNLKWFDWRSLKVSHKNDEYKPRLILASTGSGKTTLVELLSAMLMEDGVFQIFLSPTIQDGQFEHIPTYGAGANYGSMEDDAPAFITSIVSGLQPDLPLSRVYQGLWNEYILRQKLYASGKYRPVLHVFVDEWRDQAQNLGERFSSITSAWLTGVRKTFIVPWFVTQIVNVKSILMEGEGALRKNLDLIALGNEADELVPSLIQEGKWSEDMAQWWENNKKGKDGSRLAIVNDRPAFIPTHKLRKVEAEYIPFEDENNGNNSVSVSPSNNTASGASDDLSSSVIPGIQEEYESLLKGDTPSGVIRQLAKKYKKPYKEIKGMVTV